MYSSIVSQSLARFLKKTSKEVSTDIFLLTVPPDRKFGDICINVFPAVKALKTSPQILTQAVLDHMTQEDCVIRGEIQGGFVNLFVTDKFFIQELSHWRLPTFEKKDENIIIDYMGANIGKPLHIGHLCTPLFGQATINLLRVMGYNVTADMHQGDWGGIFGKLITGWKYFGDEEAFEKDPVHHLLEIYVAITEKIEKEPDREQECRDAFRLLSEGNKASIKLWQQFTDKSLTGVRAVMSEFGVHPDIWIGESFYEGLPLPKLGNWPDLSPDNTMSAVVCELVEKGIATKNDDGSVGIVFEDSKKKEEINNKGGAWKTDNQKQKTKNISLPSCILQKRDGTHGYLASDLAAIKYRLKNWAPSRIVYFVDNRQALHFRQLFATAQKAWSDGKDIELTHASNGFVSLSDGAMSTRHGRVIFLKDLIDESFDRVKKILTERERKLGEDDIKAIALGAIVYSFLSQDRERDWIFEWDKVLAFEGNSGPYLQYTFVRWKKVLEEIPADPPTMNDQQLTIFDRDVITDILSFNEIFMASGETYKFHLLVGHLATLARHLNALYVNTPKLTETPKNERAARVQIIRTGLDIIRYTADIIGMPLPESM